jgi:putative oxygen-independent coproporphyrinogen III oxidase
VTSGSIELQALPPLSLYIHIPWCVKKCPYCDFNSHTSAGELPEQDYVAALLLDIDQQLQAVQGRSLVSIFFGGGTPSLFSAAAIADLLSAIRQRIQWHPDIEITLEANPGTVDEQHFSGFRDAGINRLSLGVQSFDDSFLLRLGRIHNGEAAERALHAARAAGFDNINLDLMYGLPGQGADDACADLAKALELAPTHLSWYELTLEPNTEFYKQPPVLPREDAMEAIEQSGRKLLQQAGYQRYEVSAYARDGLRSQHNSNYWQFGDYLGLGAGAHSKISQLAQQRIYRQWQTRMPTDYINAAGQGIAGSRELTLQSLPIEFMMNALRLSDGVTRDLYAARTGTASTSIEPILVQLQQQGLLLDDSERICTSASGGQFLDSVLQAFMTD